jgi:hypothetical protein
MGIISQHYDYDYAMDLNAPYKLHKVEILFDPFI